ncbi:MAG: PAS domain-containing protein [Lachnospiraceae bacterium]|nr:PAS domain-containing protein [Lachnospiraceae bacterium]
MKNSKYRLYAIIEFLICVYMVAIVLLSLTEISGFLSTEADKAAIGEIICTILGLAVGAAALSALTHRKSESFSDKLFAENERLQMAAGNDCSLIFKYYVKTDEYRWCGDSEKIFNISGRRLKLEEFTHPDDWPVILQQFEDAKRNKLYSCEVRLLDAEGKYRMCRCHTIVDGDSGGEELIIGIIQV